MKITKEKLIELNACEPSVPWFEANGSEDLLTTLLTVNKYKPEWATWLFSRLMNHKQRVEIATFCAEKVIDVFEEKYPYDNQPRKAIDAAKEWLKNPTEENRKSAAHAADAAAYAAAAYSASAADAADAAAAATYAAYLAANAAAYTGADAAYAAAAAAYSASAADAADAAAAEKLRAQEDIIYEAVRILDRDETGGK